MKVEQLSIFLENKAGRLAQVTKTLAEAGINIRALSLADTSDFGILRLIVNDTEKAINIMKEAGFTVGRTAVVAVEVDDKPGGLNNILEALSGQNVNVEYMYAFVQEGGGSATMIFRFDRIDQAIEVLKGSSQVQYGPFTTGGAINLVSTPIPNSFSGKANISYGSKNTFKSHTSVGSSWKHFGYMVEYLRYQSDGFKKYEDHAAKGFKRNDIIAKIRVKTDHVKGVNHALELKFGYADENSDETYVGLSADDFKKTPFLRYAGSQMDKLLSLIHI